MGPQALDISENKDGSPAGDAQVPECFRVSIDAHSRRRWTYRTHVVRPALRAAPKLRRPVLRFTQGIVPQTRGAASFWLLNCVVSLVVILLRFPIDLRGPSYNTDAQNIT